MSSATETVLKKLDERLRALAPAGVALAYSGGVDSALLLAALAKIFREKPFPLLALTMRSALSPQGANGVPDDIPHETIDVAPLDDPDIRNNPRERCYFCKRRFFGLFKKIAGARGLKILMDGTNADDLRDFRPGLRAARELGVVSPLAETGICKAEIRAAARALRLPEADKPSAPCLATRFPTGAELTESALRAVDCGENFLRKFLPSDAPLRLRVHGDTARIETLPEHFQKLVDARTEIVARLRELGFKRATLDLDGFHSGGMNAGA